MTKIICIVLAAIAVLFVLVTAIAPAEASTPDGIINWFSNTVNSLNNVGKSIVNTYGDITKYLSNMLMLNHAVTLNHYTIGYDRQVERVEKEYNVNISENYKLLVYHNMIYACANDKNFCNEYGYMINDDNNDSKSTLFYGVTSFFKAFFGDNELQNYYNELSNSLGSNCCDDHTVIYDNINQYYKNSQLFVSNKFAKFFINEPLISNP